MYSTAFLDVPPLAAAAGAVTLPGSKSISNRVLLLSALFANILIGAVVGIISDQDVLYQEVEADEHQPYVAPFLDWVVNIQSLGAWERRVEKAFAVTASDLMTKPVHVVPSGAAVHEAAKTMAKERISMLPVVDDGRYVGLFTRDHVVAALDRLEFGGGGE